jgi:hypothetical protein
MWNVYANRVYGLLFRGDLCNTLPWMMTRSPGEHGVKMYSPSGISRGGNNCSKPVPPSGRRTNLLTIGVVMWEPGRKDIAPLSSVQGSKAIQKPSALGGSVYRNVESLCSGTSPPI